MRVLLAGATGETGLELLRILIESGHVVRVLVRSESIPKLRGEKGSFEIHSGDVTRADTLAGCCAQVDAVISTITRTSRSLTHEQVDYAGNLALLREAERAGCRSFIYVSSVGAGSAPDVPTLREKGRFEKALQASSLRWFIVRPSALFQDMDRIFEQSAKGTVTLFGTGEQLCTPMAEEDLAAFVVANLEGPCGLVTVGGPETLSLRQVGELCLAVRGMPPRVRYLPLWLFTAVVGMVRLVSPASWPVVRFVQYVFTTDNQADEVGARTLQEHFRERLAGQARHAARSSLYRS